MTPEKADGIPAASADELQGRLRESLKKRRPRRWRWALGFTLFLAALFGLLIWHFFPSGEPPRVVVTAFDDLAVAGKETSLQGCLEAPAEPNLALAGREVVFADGQAPLVPNHEVREVYVPTGMHGEASCLWTFPAATIQGDFILRQRGGKFFPGMEDHGLIFLMPAATPVCLVQIEKTLSSASDDTWRIENVHDIAAEIAAAPALEVIANKGYQIVYLTLADQPILYQRMRGWVRLQSAEARPPFPSGPVISRFQVPWADHDRHPWQKTAERLAQRFPLPQGGAIARHLALAGTIDVARQFHAADWQTVYVGVEGDLPAGVGRANGWESVPRTLEK
jgi:hypothetical protein